MRITDLDREYIAAQIEDCFTYGQFGSSDNERGRIAWELRTELIDDND